MTDNLRQFLDSIESADREWAASFDIEALENLRGDELDYVRQILLSRLEIADPRVPRALALVPNDDVVVALRKRLPECEGRMRIATADALIAIEGPRDDTAAIIRQGVENPDFLIANKALRTVPKLGRPSLEFLIPTMARHPEPNIRTAAAMNALFLTGVNDSPLSWDHREIVAGLASEKRAERQQSFDALCELMGIQHEVQVP
jgi:hypothetical protein